jgi:hypothetical protein
MAIAVDMTGFQSGRLTVVARVEGKDRTCAYWECSCECGGATIQRGKDLRTGKVKSCGCLNRQPITGSAVLSHGHTSGCKVSGTYASWLNIKQRCTNPNNPKYADYGGRGITVCERWLKSFENFLADMGEKPEGAGWSIDRFPDNNGNYEPGNCRWATDGQQRLNKRTTRLITWRGDTKTLQEWAELSGKPNAIQWLWKRLKDYPLDEAMKPFDTVVPSE